MAVSQDQEIIRQEIINRFSDFVTNTANSGISWGTNSLPFPEFPSSYFKGSTAGESVSVSASNLGAAGGPISASAIYNELIHETNRYTNIRKLRARRYLTGFGYDADGTAIANLADSYQQPIGTVALNNISSGQEISASNLINYFSDLRAAYLSKRSSLVTIDVTYCHSSCHTSCHGSRGRR